MPIQNLDLLSFAWTAIYSAINSNFGIAITGGGIGAFGGALGAQYITERGDKRREFLSEIRQANKAILISSQICNFALALKKQFVQPLGEKYAQVRDDIDYSSRLELFAGDKIHLELDLVKFPIPSLPIEALRNLVFSNLSVVGKELSAVTEIERAHAGLTQAVAQRELFIERVSSGEVAENEHLLYLGRSLPDGRTDTTYPDLVNLITGYTDDLAFFSVTLCEDLMAHGQRVADELCKQFCRIKRPHVSNVDFSGPRRTGLLVSNTGYESWLWQFKSHDLNRP
ncbi:hypothetical protein [Comamonas sp.]|uniref:hypothetical protein n=1 Tax=Comamonas sp. TaxID=34028 RepID=UPI002590B338|nr:hypothetical protein [Comamonas sp.]